MSLTISDKIDLSGPLNPARLFGQSFEERAGFKEISVVLKPDTDADDATLEKWAKAIEVMIALYGYRL